MTKDEALKLGLQVVEAAEYLANNPAIFGEYVQEKRALKRALIQRSKIAFEEALAQPEQESDDLTAAYLSGVYDGKNKYAPQPEQEPVAWVNLNELSEQINSVSCGTVYGLPYEAEGYQPLYTTPPQRKPLTDEEIDRLNDVQVGGCQCSLWYIDGIKEFARAIEAAHGIKGE